MQYLHHLEDCHRVAKHCCKANSSTLQLLLDEINSIEGHRVDDETSQISHLELVMKDLEYLHDEINSSLLRISDIRRNLRESLELLQTRRTSILGILAALYLPLSFVTVSSRRPCSNDSQLICRQSFLGMNLDQYTAPHPSWRNTTAFDIHGSQTYSNQQIVDTGSNQAWTLANFFEIAMPLMVGTIFVPLVIGSIIRVLLQGLSQGRTWWRLFFALIVIGLA